VKDFMTSSKPELDQIYSFCINLSDKNVFQYYESCNIRVNGARHHFGGDWLVAPPPCLFMMEKKGGSRWVSLGLAAQPGQNRFMGNRCLGGVGFGLVLDYMG
jgi:hypothetical protein